MNVALNEDCMAVMARYPDKYFDLAVVDPPYGINVCAHKNPYSLSVAEDKEYEPYYGNDRDAPGPDYFVELQRVSKNQVIFGANHFISRIPNADASCWIVWDKENGDNCFADCELALTTFPSAVRIFHFRWQGMLQGNMKNKEIRIHPTQKPMELYRWIYRKYAKPGYKSWIPTWAPAAPAGRPTILTWISWAAKLTNTILICRKKHGPSTHHS